MRAINREKANYESGHTGTTWNLCLDPLELEMTMNLDFGNKLFVEELRLLIVAIPSVVEVE